MRGLVGVSLLTKAQVQPLHLERLEVSIREQARSHRFSVIRLICSVRTRSLKVGRQPGNVGLIGKLHPAPAEDPDDFIQMPRHRLLRGFCIPVLQGVEDQAVFVLGAERHVVGGVVRL